MPKVEEAPPAPKKTPRTTVKTKTPVYPHEEVIFKRGADALTVKEAKDLLGWTTDPEEARKFEAGEWLLTDAEGKHVWCLNNLHNRNFTEAWARQLCQDILNLRWKFNLETIIIGRYGNILSGQHRLIGLVLAGEKWASQAERKHWEKNWPNEPTMETLLARGGDESDEVTQTLDNVRPRTLGDVLFVGGEFRDVAGKDKDVMTKMTDAALKLLWLRTGRGVDQYSPRRTHSEALDFLAKHPRIKEAVRHIHEQNKDNRIGKLLGPGSAAALMYMMGASASTGEDYHASEDPGEKYLDFKFWDKAKDFWTLLAMPNSELKDLRLARRPVEGDSPKPDQWSGYVFGSSESGLGERIACLIKGWGVFLSGDKVTAGKVRLHYSITETNDGFVSSADLMETPRLEGVDLGDVKKTRRPKPKDEIGGAEEPGPNPPGTGGVNTDEVKADQAMRELEVMKSQNPGRLIVVAIKNGYGVFGQDALEAARVLKLKARTSSNSLPSVGWDAKSHPQCLAELTAAGHKVAVCRRDDKGKVKSDRHDPAPPPTVKADTNKKVKKSK